LLAILLVAAIVGAGGAALQYSARWVQHTREVLRTVRELQSVLLEAESQALQVVAASRPSSGLSTSDSTALSVLDPTRAGPVLGRLVSLTADNPAQQARANAIADLVGRWLEERRDLASGAAAVASPRASGDLLNLLAAFQADESALYEQRVARQQRWRLFLIGSVMVALVLVAVALRRMTGNVVREAKRRVATEMERDRARQLLAFALDRSPLAVGVMASNDALLVNNTAWQNLDVKLQGSLAQTLTPIVERVRSGGEAVLVELVAWPGGATGNERDPSAGSHASSGAPDDGARSLAVSAQPVSDDAGAAVGLILIDMTEQRWLEMQLRHAQRMEALGRLAGGVAHDINNVVTAIIGFTDMAILGTQRAHGERGGADGAAANEDAAPSQVELDLLQVRRSADRASMMARQLLAFSRQSVARRRPIDLGEVLRDLEPMLRRILGSHVVFRVSQDAERWAVSADPGLIEQVVLNLAINARDAMERGGELQVDVRTVPRQARDTLPGQPAWAGPRFEGDAVSLVVRDSGSGMTAQVQQRIFDAFFTTKPEGKGTGLGLATVRQIVEDLGGYLLVDSAPGRGTTMTVLFARVPGEPEPIRSNVRAHRMAGRNASLLVVEDDRDVRYLAEYVLGDAGYSVHTARNGAEALSAIERATRPYDLLITDLVMPDVGGVALGTHPLVRERVGRTLYLSGYPADALGAQTALPVDVAFLAKPFTPAELLEAVDGALDAASSS
jgi:signal transduction histidine kinase/ActR/RegA family two-component response regulator